MSYNKDTGMYEGYIYCITNIINNKKYIGQTTRTIEKRMSQHFADSFNNKLYPQAITLAIHKYGKENFKIEQIMKVIADTKEELIQNLNTEEIFCIQWYESLYSQHGYNIDYGGSKNNTLMKPVDVYDYNGNYLTSFESCCAAANYYNITDVCVNYCCNGKTTRCLNPEVIFRFKGDSFDKFKVFNDTQKVYQFDLSGNLVNVYLNAFVAAKYVNGYISNIRFALSHNNSTAYGFYWSYTDKFDYDNSHKTNKRVSKYSLSGELLGTYDSLSKAAQSEGHNPGASSHLNKACAGEILHPIWDRIWRYEGDSFDKYPIEQLNMYNKKLVNQYDLCGNFIKSYISAKEACRLNNIPLSGSANITACCKGKRNKAYDSKWFYADDPNQPDKSKIITSN